MKGIPSVLAIDQGTTGTTCLVVAQDGRILGRAYSEFTQYYPQPGHVEHDAEEIWEVTKRVCAEVLDSAGEEGEIVALGIANQRETVVIWDRETLRPLHRAIVWQDRRTAGICRELREAGHEGHVRTRTGLLLDPYFSGTKLTWLFRKEPGLRARAEAGDLAAGTIDSWLAARLTGGREHVTDHTNASRTLLYDLAARDWDPGLLDLLEVPRGVLPEVRESSCSFGVTSGEALGIEVPLAGVAGDQQAALFGQGCWKRGSVKNTYGTGAFLLLYTGKEPVLSRHGLLATMACDESGGPAYALEGSVFIAGAAIQWLRDGLRILASADQSEAMARELDGNDGVYFVPAFVGLGAPHWEPEARGTIVGITRGTSRAHLVRAALEGIAYSVHDVLRAMEADSGVDAEDLRVDGGAASNDWLMEFQSGVLGIPVRRAEVIDTTALGAAGLAGLEGGVWRNGEEFLAVREDPTLFRPAMEPAERDARLRGWRRALETTRAWVGS